MTAVDQQQLKDTEAKISCTVDGLTTALNGVKWTKADNTEITSGSGGFVIEAGTLSGNTQTTILTVPASDNTLDTTYNCLITSTEHGKTDDSTSVSLKVFSKYSCFDISNLRLILMLKRNLFNNWALNSK